MCEGTADPVGQRHAHRAHGIARHLHRRAGHHGGAHGVGRVLDGGAHGRVAMRADGTTVTVGGATGDDAPVWLLGGSEPCRAELGRFWLVPPRGGAGRIGPLPFSDGMP